MKDGFLRVACATPEIRVADCEYNAKNIVECIKQAHDGKASLVVLPELCITGYSCGDLFLQSTLLSCSKNALLYIAKQTSGMDIISVVGLPFADGSVLYNCAAVVYKGKVLALVPKSNIPNYSEFYEMRHFVEGCKYKVVNIGNQNVPLGYDVLFCCNDMPEFKFGVEICEDLWISTPPSCDLAAYGATLIVNLSASNEVVGKSDYRRNLVNSQAAKTITAYLYANSGFGESTTDMVYSGHNIISENGTILAESERFTTGVIFAEVDLQKMESERRRLNTYSPKEPSNTVTFDMQTRPVEITREIKMHPFIPSATQDLSNRCEEVIKLQSVALATRLRHTKIDRVVIGLSGGMDSTLALISTVHAFDMQKLNRKNIICVTMPCFGTSERTKNNAKALADAYGVTLLNIPIHDAVLQHFMDIGQDVNKHDITYENSQARERTQVLMDVANKNNALVIGTGDLSELALGWATYNGDHMSMYSINSSVPKTLVRYLVEYEANSVDKSLGSVLMDILNTPVSPELLPAVNGDISQKTENIVGPYEIHDFFLYYMVRFGFSPKKVFRIACYAFDGVYDKQTIHKWLKVFIRRFFTQQFKRSCLPDGPKIGSVSLSPRSDWRMPSDACYTSWVNELDNIKL